MNIFYGDSLTSPAIAQALPGRTAWPWWIHLLQGDPIDVRAIGGQRSNQQTAVIYGHPPQPGERFFYLIGTNDRLNNGVDPAGVTLFKNTVAAQAYWLAGKSIAARQPGWTYTGVWADYASYHPWAMVGRYTQAPGSTASAQFNGDELVVGYTMADGTAGVVQVSVDGAYRGTFTLAPPRPIANGGGNPWAPSFLRLTGSGPGLHTVKLTLTSGILMLDWIGQGPNGNHVYLLTLPYTPNGDTVNVDAYNTAVRAIVTALDAGGYNVHLLDANAVIKVNEMCADMSGYNLDGEQGRVGIASGSYHLSNHADIKIAVQAIKQIDLE